MQPKEKQMEAKELRIGNYLFDCDGSVFQIHDGITIDLANHERYGFKPIPLTKEWLLKFGFEKLPHCRYKLDVISLEHTSKDNFNVNDTLCWIDYVHQLQNLYFALTGEELQIKD